MLMTKYEDLPATVQKAGNDLLAKLKTARTCGDTVIVNGWFIETHTLGCRYEAGTPEEDWWDEHYKIFDEYSTDSISVVEGDPTDGIFITFTPTTTNKLTESANWKNKAAQLFPEEYREFKSLVGRRPDAVEFTTIENDVKRRDLTINALFYDIDSQEVVDLVGGLEDLEKGVVRAVGDPSERFDEDRLRILRAIRFAARMGAGLDKPTEDAIRANNSLEGVSPERIRDEFLKSIKSAQSVRALHRLYDSFNLWEKILPGLKLNTWYEETKNIPVQLALLTRDNNPKVLSQKLNNLKYSVVETRQIAFLNLFQNLSPENAYHLKKLWKPTRLSPEDLKEFAQLSGEPDMNLVDAFIKYEPSVSGQELMAQGLKGREIGQEIERRETELFTKLVK